MKYPKEYLDEIKLRLKVSQVVSKSVKLINLVTEKKAKNTYSLSEEQVNSILDLRLQKLTALGIYEIETEIKKISELIIGYKKIMHSVIF